MKNTQVQILSAVNTATATGSAFYAGQIASASFATVMGDATAAGTVKIQCSNDIPPAGTSPAQFIPTNWSDVPSATSAIASGVGPAIVIGNMCFGWIRAVYTRTSGGSSTVILNMNTLAV